MVNRRSANRITSEQQLNIFEFIVRRTVWCDLLSKVNFSGKGLQSLAMHTDIATVHRKEDLLYFEYRDSVFTNSLVRVKELAHK
jgi:hypothetical protein